MNDWTKEQNSVYKTIGASNHTNEAREADDYYATDPQAIDKLLTVVNPYNRIWEPACGGGHLSERLTELGYYVYSSDIVDRGYKRHTRTRDFLKAVASPFSGNFDIITNPPYKYAKEFVLKALELLPHGCRCFMFLKLTFLEGKARYNEIFKHTPPKAVYALPERLQCAKNGNFERYKNGALAYAWFVWQKGWTGQTILDWFE